MVSKGFTRVSNEDSFEKSLEGLDIFQRQAVLSDAEEIVVRAPAGSGKTKSTIAAVAAYRYEHLNDRICAITYTRAARAEMEARLQELGVYDVEVNTIHVWARNLLQHFSVLYDFKIRILEEPQIKSILEEIVEEYLKKSKMKKINIDILYSYITANKNMDITDNYRRTLNALELRYIKYKRENHLYDFTDYPLYLYDVLEIYNEEIKNIDALFVDEFQDVDSTQLDIFKKVQTKKKFFVGDEWQCQPYGTKVLVRSKDGGYEKNIEELEIGDPLVYYDQSKGYVSGQGLPHNAILKRITNIQKYEYKNDYLITLKSENGLESSYTSNHRTFVRFNRPQDKEAHVVYLMCDENNRFRVGKIPLYYTSTTGRSRNSWREKMRAEGCVKIWFLKIFDTDHEARVEETKVSYKYQIPQTCWQTEKVQWTKHDIEYIYDGLDTYSSAIQCLKDYQLSILYPLLDENVEWQKRSHFTSNASSEIYAINLIPGFMSCLVYGSDSNHQRLHAEEIVEVNKKFISADASINVCALEVEGETYVADKIITHNSIFQFRNADGKVFSKLPGFTEYKLKCNYRSYQEIIDYAATVYLKQREHAWMDEECYISEVMYSKPSGIRCNRGFGGNVMVINPFGRILSLGDESFGRTVSEIFSKFMALKPMILCRTNKQVKMVQSWNYFEVSTVHQAKGLEYPSVIVIDNTISNIEDLNIAYVAMTRAEDNLLVINWQQFENLFTIYSNKNKIGGF